jgi:nanoRNase/pAp phosphatase (c-di-AMP/oligoRNAs hydrolase)
MLSEILSELNSGSKCVLLHVNADPDALGSAAALSLSFPEVTIGSVEGLSKNGKLLQKVLDIEVTEKPDLSQYDKVIVVDTASPDRLGEYQKNLENLIVIDHHLKRDKWQAKYRYTDENRASCSEIIYEILRLGDKKITKKIGIALCAGILTDSGKFSYADSKTLRIFSDIMEEGNIGMDEILTIFSEDHETDYSKRISRLKGAQRLKYESIGRFIIATSFVGSFESSVCGSLLNIGADCAFVGSQRGEEFRISGRANQALVSLGLHLGNLFSEIGAENGCEGGGHDGAAGLSGTGDVEAFLNICLIRAKMVISKVARP